MVEPEEESPIVPSIAPNIHPAGAFCPTYGRTNPVKIPVLEAALVTINHPVPVLLIVINSFLPTKIAELKPSICSDPYLFF